VPKQAFKPSADRILAAAEKLFAKHGYAAVPLRQLIAGAGVSTTAFYARFPSKEAVLDALTERLFRELYQDAGPVLRAAPHLEGGIERGIDLLCTRLGPRKPLVRLVIAEAGTHVSSAAARSRSYRMLVAFLAYRLQSLRQRGRIGIAEADEEPLAWAVIGAIELQIVRWAVWDELSLEELREQLLVTVRTILPKERP
jgi:AcrR family transcriptional regulator